MTPDWLQYGALGLLAMLLGGATIYLRERDRRAEERQTQTDTFIRDLVKRSLDAIDASVLAHQSIADAVNRLCAKMDIHAATTEREHEELLSVCRNRYPPDL